MRGRLPTGSLETDNHGAVGIAARGFGHLADFQMTDIGLDVFKQGGFGRTAANGGRPGRDRQLCTQIFTGVDVGILFRETEDDGTIKVSFRSREQVDVDRWPSDLAEAAMPVRRVAALPGTLDEADEPSC